MRISKLEHQTHDAKHNLIYEKSMQHSQKLRHAHSSKGLIIRILSLQYRQS